MDDHNMKEYIMYGIDVKIQEKENEIKDLSTQVDDRTRKIRLLKNQITKILELKTTI